MSERSAVASPAETIAFLSRETKHVEAADRADDAPLPDEHPAERPSRETELDSHVTHERVADRFALVPGNPAHIAADSNQKRPAAAENVPQAGIRRWPEDVEELRALVLPTEPLRAELATERRIEHVANTENESKPRTEKKKTDEKLSVAPVGPSGVAGAESVKVHSASEPTAKPAVPEPKSIAATERTAASQKRPLPIQGRSERDTSRAAPKSAIAFKGADAAAASIWPMPEALLAQLAALAKEPETQDWAVGVETAIRKFGPALSEGTAEALPLAARLEQLSEQGGRLAGGLGDRPLAAQLRRTVYALERRLAVWKPIARAGGMKADTTEKYSEDLTPLAATLDEVESVLDGSPEGTGWRRFLELDALHKLVSDRSTASHAHARVLARKVLDRLVCVPLKEPQRQFLRQDPLAKLDRGLRRLAAEPVSFKDLLRCVEQFEQDATPHEARMLAELYHRLAHSNATQKQAVAQSIESYYRNANVRLVVAGELLNRFIPERPREYNEVYDVVLGKPVWGSSLTATHVNLRLIPDPRQIHVALDVNGTVAASTHSVSGPARFYNESHSVYRGWKEIEIGPEGMQIHPAQVAVNNESTLRGLSTDFDELPLIGALAQEVARSQHNQKRCEIRSEVEQKIAARAQWQIDQESEARLGTAADHVRAAVLEPLAELSLGPTLVSAETSERRIAMRLRIVTERQLGSHTPRPQAPADSAVSFQIHESAINNLFEQVGLNGATLTLPQLRARIANRLKCADLLRVDTENDDVTIAFAARDAVRVACRDGQFVLTLAIARLAKPPHAWEDFQVRVFLRPRIQGRMVQLLREDVIHLMGSRLNMRSQIALRGVFGKTFAKDRPLSIVPDRIVNEPRLQDLVFTQWVIEDGWIGAALGPGRVARKQSSADDDAARIN